MTNFVFLFKNSSFFFVLSLSKSILFVQKISFCFFESNFNKILYNSFIFKSNKMRGFFFNVQLVVKSIVALQYFSNFFFKNRFRVSGLGFGLEFLSSDVDFFKFLVGFSQVPLISIPSFIKAINTNQKKKKISIYGLRNFEVNFFIAKVRALRPCDSYKQKGVRFRFEKIFLKEGKRGLRR